MKNSTTAFDKFLSPYKTKENLAKENRNTKTYELSFVTELCNTYNCEAAFDGIVANIFQEAEAISIKNGDNLAVKRVTGRNGSSGRQVWHL